VRVIAYASRALTEAEKRYCITRKELLGVVFGLKKFRQHLLGRPMVVRTDHAALTHLLRTKEPIGQQGRRLDLLGEFQLTIQHRPGRVHSNSDGLSHRPCLQDDEVECKQCSWATNPNSHGTTRLVEQQSPDDVHMPSVADAVSDQLANPLSSDIVPIAEIQSLGEITVPPVAESIVESSNVNTITPTLGVQPSSLVDVVLWK